MGSRVVRLGPVVQLVGHQQGACVFGNCGKVHCACFVIVVGGCKTSGLAATMSTPHTRQKLVVKISGAGVEPATFCVLSRRHNR